MGLACFAVRALDDLARKRLRRLRSPQSESVYRLDHLSVGIDSLEGVDNGKRGDGSVALTRFVDHASNRLVRHQRSRGIVNDDDLTFTGKVLQSVRNGL